MKVYISGPISGIEDHNRPAFNSAAALLHSWGHEAVNPLEIPAGSGASWIDYMRADIAAMMACDALFALPGWQSSRGACIEVQLAQSLGIPIMH